MTDLKWTPVTIRLGQIEPWSDNPRMSSKAQAERLIQSERELGQVQTVAIGPAQDNGKHPLYDGHQRVSAWYTVKGADFELTALQSNRPLTEDERRKMAVLLHTATGGWNWDRLAGWRVGELKEWGLVNQENVKGWNSDALNVKELLKAEQETQDAEPQINRTAELLEKWQVKTGDLWQIGSHKLICGDCTDAAVVARVMGGERASFTFADPPYGYKYQSNMRTQTKQFDVLENDDKFIDFVPNVQSFSNGWTLVCTSWKVIKEWLDICGQFGNLDNVIVWDKGGGGMGDLIHSLSTDYELILAYGRGETIKGKRIGSVWSIGKDAAVDYEHATQKPVELLVTALNTFSLSGCLVYEPFSGSGTTIVACQNLSRKCRAIEISPAYVAVALERMATAFPELEIRRIDSINESYGK